MCEGSFKSRLASQRERERERLERERGRWRLHVLCSLLYSNCNGEIDEVIKWKSSLASIAKWERENELECVCVCVWESVREGSFDVVFFYCFFANSVSLSRVSCKLSLSLSLSLSQTHTHSLSLVVEHTLEVTSVAYIHFYPPSFCFCQHFPMEIFASFTQWFSVLKTCSVFPFCILKTKEFWFINGQT